MILLYDDVSQQCLKEDGKTQCVIPKIFKASGGKGESVFDVGFLGELGDVLIAVRVGGSMEWFRHDEDVAIGVRGLDWDSETRYVEAVVRKGGVLVVGGKTEGKEQNGFGVALDENGEY